MSNPLFVDIFESVRSKIQNELSFGEIVADIKVENPQPYSNTDTIIPKPEVKNNE